MSDLRRPPEAVIPAAGRATGVLPAATAAPGEPQPAAGVPASDHVVAVGVVAVGSA